ncbi:MAG: sulfatase-like hydrolase/transferase [Candidatus Latescibacterota bacterium]|nr:MAG: sulfatase-like hydrolase/transferase [Candidatus Latescibacterota bacterium]
MHPLTVALAAGLTIGFVDVSLAIVARPPAWATITHVIPPLAASSLIACVVTLCAVLIALPARLVLKGSDDSLIPAVAAFIVVAVVVLDYGHTAPFVRNPYRVLFALVLAAVVAWMILVRPMRTERGKWITVTLPFVLFAGTVFQWLFHYRAGATLSPRGILIVVGGIASIAVVCVLMRRWYRVGGRLVGGLMLVVLLSALIVPWTERPREHFSRGRHVVRHVILILIDTLRADMLGCYDNSAPETPHIDEFASECIRYEWAISPSPWTIPSMVSIMTGLPASVHGAIAKNSRVPDALTMLPERMRAAGYVTGAVVDNALLSPSHGMDRGFDSFVHFPRNVRDTSFGTAILRRILPERYREKSTTDATTDIAIDWMKRHAKQDCFFWLHIFDPHAAYEPPPRFQPPGNPPARIGRRFGDLKEIRLGILHTTPEEDEWIKELYEGEVRYVDEAVGRFLDELRSEGIYDNALIILTSDHGEEFREHGGMEHGHTLYNELLRVPLMIKLPGSATRGVVEGTVSTQRLTATVLDACNVDVGRDSLVVGTGSLLADDAVSDPIVYAAAVLYHEPQEAILLDRYKFIRRLESDTHELYDLEVDPNEQQNIAGKRARVVSRAREILKTHSDASARLRESYEVLEANRFEMDGEMIKRLRSLGYL